MSYLRHLISLSRNGQTEMPAGNSRFAKAGFSCFYDSEVLNSSFVHIMKFSAKNPRLRKAANRWWLPQKDTKRTKKTFSNDIKTR